MKERLLALPVEMQGDAESPAAALRFMIVGGAMTVCKLRTQNLHSHIKDILRQFHRVLVTLLSRVSAMGIIGVWYSWYSWYMLVILCEACNHNSDSILSQPASMHEIFTSQKQDQFKLTYTHVGFMLPNRCQCTYSVPYAV